MADCTAAAAHRSGAGILPESIMASGTPALPAKFGAHDDRSEVSSDRHAGSVVAAEIAPPATAKDSAHPPGNRSKANPSPSPEAKTSFFTRDALLPRRNVSPHLFNGPSYLGFSHTHRCPRKSLLQRHRASPDCSCRICKSKLRRSLEFAELRGPTVRNHHSSPPFHPENLTRKKTEGACAALMQQCPKTSIDDLGKTV